jgi:glucokinase
MIAMGIDVGGTNLRVGAVNSEGELLLSLRVPTPQSTTPDLLISTVCDLVNKVQIELNAPITGLGLGWPGAVNRKQGLVLQTPNISGFKDFPLNKTLEDKLKIPTEIENDAKCAGLAEQKFGVAKNFKDFLLLTFGTGIGGVIFANSELVQGRSGLAGEIGHFTLHPNGIPCSCGGRGCFEQYASAKALERRAQQMIGKTYSAREILDLALTNQEAKNCIIEYISDLALALGSLINIFNSEAIVFSGGLFTTGGSLILSELNEALKVQGFQTLKKDVHLVASSLEGKAGIIGAASLMLRADSDQVKPLK